MHRFRAEDGDVLGAVVLPASGLWPELSRAVVCRSPAAVLGTSCFQALLSWVAFCVSVLALDRRHLQAGRCFPRDKFGERSKGWRCPEPQPCVVLSTGRAVFWAAAPSVLPGGSRRLCSHLVPSRPLPVARLGCDSRRGQAWWAGGCALTAAGEGVRPGAQPAGRVARPGQQSAQSPGAVWPAAFCSPCTSTAWAVSVCACECESNCECGGECVCERACACVWE